ncbi:LADA_0G09076g1_1 [Lachancea dasiensis]|uniref:LADA_0G09076g1_1 n=1 Tax=Lachancea dasiensis TaxID=1072105 RepID=A0A1G4JUB7_9SACH|nr:LADA_0G09076g1_1 [Lachancea dasiensis]
MNQVGDVLESWPSDLFEIRTTSYGGRACFATRDIPADTEVLVINRSLGNSICHEFRKEVCSSCFQYEYGRTMKVRLPRGYSQIAPKGAGLWFCNEGCRGQFLSQDHIKHLVEAYETLEQNWVSQRSKRKAEESAENIEYAVEITAADVDRAWNRLECEWVQKVALLKLSRRSCFLPVIDEAEFACARFVTNCLFTLLTADENSPQILAFQCLQSNELPKIQKFPPLLQLQQNVYKTLKILLPPFLNSALNIEIFRHILGSEYGNSFGIWQLEEDSDSREYLGYWVLPEASFFNHSCAPNLEKCRRGNCMTFKLTTPVHKNQELCVDYKGILHLPVQERRNVLKDNWFFDCGCDRCLSETLVKKA